MDISPKALGPTCGLGAVLGRNALGKPGDCGQARRRLNDTKANESQGDDDCHWNAVSSACVVWQAMWHETQTPTSPDQGS